MNYLEEYNHVKGCILDCNFKSFSIAEEYINLAESNVLTSRSYYIVKDFSNSPWQLAYDFINSIKNRLKKSSKLYKESLNETILEEIPNPSIAFVDYDSISSDMLKILFSKVTFGGVVAVTSSKTSTECLSLLSELFPRSILVAKENCILIRKTNLFSSSAKPLRSRSNLT